VAIVYDGDGNRVSETVGGVTTDYLVDTVNPTGYAQVVDELVSGAVTRTYAYGLERISESQTLNATWTPSFYGYDGHGSVRQLTNAAGAVTDSYDYDAFGNLINSTGNTPNNYLFAGEQYDPALGMYYNRARYYNNSTGRFWSMDTYEGDPHSPLSLHKYLYAQDNAVSSVDPSGNQIDDVVGSMAVDMTLNAMSTIQLPGGSVGSFIASQLIPSDVLQDILSYTPDAVEVGGYVSATVNLRNPVIGFTAGAGAEFLYSPKTSNWALYTYVSPIGLGGNTATSLGGGVTAGLVFKAPHSSDYEGQFYTLTVPMAALPSNVRQKIVGDFAVAPFQGIGAVIPAPYTSLWAAIGYGLGNVFSTNGAVSFFVSPTGTHALGVSLGLGNSASVGAGTSSWSVAWSYYWQDAPSGSVPFE